MTLLKYVGLPPAYFLLRFVTFYFFCFSPASFRNIYYVYRRRLGFSAIGSTLAVYRNYYVFGQVLLDKTATLAGLQTKFTFRFEGEDHLRNLVDAKTGCLLISAHIGNFEMAGHMLERLRTKVNILMLDAEHQHIKEYLDIFTRRSFNVIAIREDNAHVYEINKALKNREILCMHWDRFVEGSKCVEMIFLGERALFPTGPFYLAMKYDIPVSFVFAMKEGRSHYHFYATAPKYYAQQGSPGKRDDMLRTLIADYVHAMENKLRQYPYQWFNYYSFWARQ